jgi:hypothetical protein
MGYVGSGRGINANALHAHIQQLDKPEHKPKLGTSRMITLTGPLGNIVDSLMNTPRKYEKASTRSLGLAYH